MPELLCLLFPPDNVYMKIGDNMVFYAIVLALIAISFIYSCFIFFRDKKNYSREDAMNFFRKILIDLFVIGFCLKKLFPDITWL